MKPFTFVLLLSCVLLSSCYQLYKPVGHRHTTMPTPNMQNAKQVYAMATAGLEHIELQAAYSLINNLAVYGGLYQTFLKPPVWDLGLGYYNKNKYFSWEVYGVFTDAKIASKYFYSDRSPFSASSYTEANYKFNCSYNSYSLLANIKFPLIEKLDLTTSFKYELQHYNDFVYDKKTYHLDYVFGGPSTEKTTEEHITFDTKNLQYLHGAITLRYQIWKLYAFAGFSGFILIPYAQVSNIGIFNPPYYTPFLLSCGVMANSDLFKKAGK